MAVMSSARSRAATWTRRGPTRPVWSSSTRAGGCVMSENAEDAYEGDNVPDVRRKLPVERKSITHKFTITGFEAGYVTAGMYEDGTVGEIFLNGIGKEGSTLFGMAQWAVVEFSIALQFGAPLE